jgi:hypothetical protein
MTRRPCRAALAQRQDSLRDNEIANLIDQMTAPELRTYLQEALFVNTVMYENQRAAAYIKRVGGRTRKSTSGAEVGKKRTRR